jgi:iron complex transport system substrate-binding protein
MKGSSPRDPARRSPRRRSSSKGSVRRRVRTIRSGISAGLPVLLVLLALAAGPLSLRATTPPREILRDALGRSFVLPEATPSRIVSMAPNITEILFALGLGPHVVGVTRFCDYPPEALGLPKIGGLVDPNIEIIQSLAPDLVIAFRGNPLRILKRLVALRMPVFVLDIGTGLDALYSLIDDLGLVTRTENEARALVAGLRSRTSAVEDRLHGLVKKPRVFVVLRGQGLWTCGGESYLNDLIARAGAVNIAASMPKKWALYSPERIIRDAPDALFVLAKSRADFEAARDWLGREAHLGGLEAFGSGRIYALDENSASRFGPRLVDVLDRMARDLHPERFGESP